MYLLPWAWVFCLFSISHEHKYFIYFPMSMSILSFFYANFKHISAYFSSTKPDFDDTSPWFMILRWYFSLHFLEKSHFAKVLDINDIILYFCRRMILWDFFREKTFLREHIWCCHLSSCWQDSSGFTSAFWWVWHLFLQKNKNNLRLAHVFQKLLLFLQLHSTAESPKGWAGGCDLYKIERLLTLICAIVNFATLQAVSRCGNEWMLTVGVFYILLRIDVYIL